MSNKQEQSNFVSLEAYNIGKLYNADAKQIVNSVAYEDEMTRSRGKFVMRLLEHDRTGALDYNVEIAASDSLLTGDEYGPQLISYRQVNDDKTVGRLSTCYISVDGIIVENELDKTKFERGYFVGGGHELREAELEDAAFEPLTYKEPEPLKALPLDFSG